MIDLKCMKTCSLVISLFFGLTYSFGQANLAKVEGYAIGVTYNHEFVLDGYVRVREWEFTGDKLSLSKLGMNSFPAVQLQVSRNLKKHKSIAISYDRYFIRGQAVLDGDITYNGTTIDGRKGVDVSPTRYYRVSAMYAGRLLQLRDLQLRYKGALVLDHIVFYVDGVVTPTSPKNEVYEGFGRQAFPYPVVGVNGIYDVDKVNRIELELSGTYIPKFESFYTEGGNIHLQYSNGFMNVGYTRAISSFRLSVGVNWRYMKLFQESREDTNELETVTIGPYIKLRYPGFRYD